MLFSVDTPADTDCIICLEPLFENGSVAGAEDHQTHVIGYLKKCRHLFHFECIWEWIVAQNTCPICRTGLTLSHLDIEAVTGPALQRLTERAMNKHEQRKDRHTSVRTRNGRPAVHFTQSKTIPPHEEVLQFEDEEAEVVIKISSLPPMGSLSDLELLTPA